MKAIALALSVILVGLVEADLNHPVIPILVAALVAIALRVYRHDNPSI